MHQSLRNLVLLSLASTALSHQAFAHVKGIFVGAQGGLVYLSGTHNYNTLNLPDKNKTGEKKIAKTGMIFGAHGGYMHGLGNGKMFVGGEVYFTLSKANHKMELSTPGGPNEGKVNIRLKHSYGAALLGGMLMNPKIFVYGRLGYEHASVCLNYSSASSALTSLSYTKNVTAIVPGAGVSYRLSDRLMIGAEYQYASFSTLRPKFPSGNRKANADLIEHRLFVKVSYSFG